MACALCLMKAAIRLGFCFRMFMTCCCCCGVLGLFKAVINI